MNRSYISYFNCSCYYNCTNVNLSAPFVQGILTSILCCLSVLTVVSNSLVLYAVFKERTLHTVGNLYIVSLSIADFIVGLIVIPINIAYFLNRENEFDKHLCKFWLVIDYVASTASIFSLFVLCVDRYCAVTQPLRYLRYRSRAIATAVILGAWLISFLWIIPITVFPDVKGINNSICETNFCCHKYFQIPAAILNYYIPCFLMLWFYAKVFMTVRKHYQAREKNDKIFCPVTGMKNVMQNKERLETTPNEQNVDGAPDLEENTVEHAINNHEGNNDLLNPQNRSKESESFETLHPCITVQSTAGIRHIKYMYQSVQSISWDNANDEKEDQGSINHQTHFWQRLFCCYSKQCLVALPIKKEVRAAKQLGAIMAAFMICWIPYFVTFTIRPLCSSCVPSEVHMFTVWLGYANSALNPFIYVWSNSNFRKPFKTGS